MLKIIARIFIRLFYSRQECQFMLPIFLQERRRRTLIIMLKYFLINIFYIKVSIMVLELFKQ